MKNLGGTVIITAPATMVITVQTFTAIMGASGGRGFIALAFTTMVGFTITLPGAGLAAMAPQVDFTEVFGEGEVLRAAAATVEEAGMAVAGMADDPT